MKRLAGVIVRRRLPILLVVAFLTLFFGYHALRVEMYTVFSDLLPRNHPYINVHNEFRRIFGGANLILLSVEVTEGDIFNFETLEKIKRLTEVIELTHGINNYQIFQHSPQDLFLKYQY